MAPSQLRLVPILPAAAFAFSAWPRAEVSRPRSRATSASVERETTRLGTACSIAGCSSARMATTHASSSSPAKNSARAYAASAPVRSCVRAGLRERDRTAAVEHRLPHAAVDRDRAHQPRRGLDVITDRLGFCSTGLVNQLQEPTLLDPSPADQHRRRRGRHRKLGILDNHLVWERMNPAEERPGGAPPDQRQVVVDQELRDGSWSTAAAACATASAGNPRDRNHSAARRWVRVGASGSSTAS